MNSKYLLLAILPTLVLSGCQTLVGSPSMTVRPGFSYSITYPTSRTEYDYVTSCKRWYVISASEPNKVKLEEKMNGSCEWLVPGGTRWSEYQGDAWNLEATHQAQEIKAEQENAQKRKQAEAENRAEEQAKAEAKQRKRAAAEAKGCSGLYVGKALTLTANLGDKVNYVITGLDSVSKQVTLNSDGYMQNVSCAIAQGD